MGEPYHSPSSLSSLCSINAAEYEAYLIGLAIALSMRIKYMRVLEDSNLMVS